MDSTDVEYRCFVGGLAWATDDLALKEAFSVYGEIVESKVRLLQRSDTRSDSIRPNPGLPIINDRETGRSRGFGFVTFRDEKSMRDAIEGMNGQNLDGRNITVNEAQSRRSGGGGGRGYGGGSGGYNRSGGGRGYGRREGGYGGGRREGVFGNGGGYGDGGGGGYGGDGGYGDGGSGYSRGGGASDGSWRT
ncbi:hypothetical protein Golob_007233 [Gossypium lobatum]|uniref:RRM domain-containing protein n=1 Tax=Gossypium lobatum TaxID=34289 RepID=A0A7J8MBV2_9ROSI|nr:hypothetical protein [Gossypium lobatum]